MCIILQCCVLLFLHLGAWLHEKTLFQHSIYIEVSRFKNARKCMQRKVLSLEEKFEISILKETRNHVVERDPSWWWRIKEYYELTYSHEHIKSTPTYRAIPPEELKAD